MNAVVVGADRLGNIPETLSAMGIRAQRASLEYFAPRLLTEQFAALIEGSCSEVPVRSYERLRSSMG